MVRSNESEALAGPRVGGDDSKGASRPAKSMPPSIYLSLFYGLAMLDIDRRLLRTMKKRSGML